MALYERSVASSESRTRALTSLNGNREAWGTAATPPDRKHYPHTFLWDGAFVAIVRARYGDATQAAQEVSEILKGQKEDGLIPNMKFGPGRARDPERKTFIDPKFSSDYSQPPLLAHATWEAAGALGEKDGSAFVRKAYPSLHNYYEYLGQTRRDSRDSLIAVIHPHETGRDSDPTFDFAKRRLPVPPPGTPVVRGVVDKVNTALDYASALNINRRHRKWDWKAGSEVFWVKDVMFNAIYAQNLQYMANLAESMGYHGEAREYLSRSQQVEHDVLSNMWDETTQAFHAIDRDGNKLPTISVSNLFPVVLPHISRPQLQANLGMLEAPEWFGTPYPIPSVPVNDRRFDGSYSEKRLWRGPTWMNMNWYIVEGLLNQRDRFKDEDPEFALRLNGDALRIASASKHLVENEGYREFYDPHKGHGKRVENFAWSTLGELVTDRIPEMVAFIEERHILGHKNGKYR